MNFCHFNEVAFRNGEIAKWFLWTNFSYYTFEIYIILLIIM